MKIFRVHYKVRRGLGPEWIDKAYDAAFDDIDPEATDAELRKYAGNELEQSLYRATDYTTYGVNWIIDWDHIEQIN